MAFTLDYRTLIAFYLAFARSLGWLLVVPPFSGRQSIPPLASVACAGGLGMLVASRVPAAQIPTSAIGLIGQLVVEILTGIAIGYLIALLLSAFTTAGAFIDQMGGFNLPPSIDPLTQNQSSMIGQFYEQVAIALLFVSGGYMTMIDGFARSFETPAFTLTSLGRVSRVLVVDFGTYFLSAMEIAAPLLAVLFATQIVLAMLTKAAPQMNVWILGLPLQIFIAIMLVALGLSVIPTYLTNLVTRALGDGLQLFGG